MTSTAWGTGPDGGWRESEALTQETPASPRRPRLVVVSGVSGSGKSSVARELARRCGLCYLEGDDFHSRAAKARMAQGIPLDDAWREPWIDTICEHLRCLAADGRECVLAFSGLRRRYREPLRHLGFQSCFLLLKAPRDVVAARLEERQGHFMPPSLVDSQFQALEEPAGEEDLIPLDASPPLEEVVARATELLNCPPLHFPSSPTDI